MSERARFWLAWLIVAALALALTWLPTPASHLAGHYVPVGNDSFYHARRILDMMADPASLHQFDPKVHVPEGSVLIWPWGYDYAMSLLGRAGVAVAHTDPMTVLTHLPPLAFPLALALTMFVCRRLALGLSTTAVALAFTAFLPLNFDLYGVGNLDHHFAEELFVIGALLSGLAWLANPDSRARAAIAGVVLGVATCIHNGLFVLQVPLVLALGVQWLRREPRPATTRVFAISLLLATLLTALPSPQLRGGEFQFYTLSWFHVYFAACSGAAAWFLSRVDFSTRGAILLGIALAAAVAPVASQVLLADRFFSVQVEGAADISETQSILELVRNRGSLGVATGLYSLLVLVVPFTLLLCGVQAWRERRADRRFFWITCLLGLAMLMSMVRMHVFGSFALLLPWLVFLSDLAKRGSLAPVAMRVLLAAFAAVALTGARTSMRTGRIAGNDPYYALTYDLYTPLADECARHPGVVLSNLDDANYVRFHTDCSVIANNFLLTAFHESKVREVRRLLSLTAAELPAQAPAVRYVFVHRQSLFRMNPGGGMQFIPTGDPGNPDPALVTQLMNSDPATLAPRYRLIQELAFEKPAHVPFARLYAIEGEAPR